MAMHLTFRKERCKGCGLCITVCPKQILALEDGTNIKGYRPAHCTMNRSASAAQAAQEFARIRSLLLKRTNKEECELFHEKRNLEGQ